MRCTCRHISHLQARLRDGLGVPWARHAHPLHRAAVRRQREQRRRRRRHRRRRRAPARVRQRRRRTRRASSPCTAPAAAASAATVAACGADAAEIPCCRQRRSAAAGGTALRLGCPPLCGGCNCRLCTGGGGWHADGGEEPPDGLVTPAGIGTRKWYARGLSTRVRAACKHAGTLCFRLDHDTLQH